VDFAVCYRTNVEGLHCLPTLACNGLRVGDVACVAPAAGNIAYTLLAFRAY